MSKSRKTAKPAKAKRIAEARRLFLACFGHEPIYDLSSLGQPRLEEQIALYRKILADMRRSPARAT